MPMFRIPVPLRVHTDGQTRVTVTGSTAGQALDNLIETYPILKDSVFEGDGFATSTWESMNVMLGYFDIRELQGKNTPVADDDVLMLIRSWPAAISGGKQYNQAIGAPSPDEQ